MKEFCAVKAIRAWTYMQLVNAYGTVPFYTKPMLTTDEINKFMKDPNHATVNAQSLADSLADRLIPMEYVEYYYGYPQYENYSNLCHSSKCMFPVSIVLGDLYLLKGDTESCKKAAQCYYDFLSYKYGGPIRVNSYYSLGNWVEGMDEPIAYYAVTQEQADKLMEVINTATKLYSQNTAVLNIITEQTDAFFAGQKTAEEVGKLVQGKMSIYVNEQR